MILVFIGIQGSGKGTQARILQENNNFKLYETGSALREIAKKDTDLGKLVKEIIDAGKHVSPAIIEDILRDLLSDNIGNNIVLDGFVRNRGNKISVDNVVGDYKIVFFELSKEEAIKRLVGRMYNPKTQETFPSGTLVDPKTGETLIKRIDDEEKAIFERINLFYNTTMPIVEEYRKEGNLIEVNANQSVEAVNKELLEKLGL